MSLDTAFTKSTTADYSAVTMWGVFNTEELGENVILLNAFKGRYDFPEHGPKKYDFLIFTRRG